MGLVRLYGLKRRTVNGQSWRYSSKLFKDIRGMSLRLLKKICSLMIGGARTNPFETPSDAFATMENF